MEPSNGRSRNQYLRDHNVHTYFIIPPARRWKVSIDREKSVSRPILASAAALQAETSQSEWSEDDDDLSDDSNEWEEDGQDQDCQAN